MTADPAGVPQIVPVRARHLAEMTALRLETQHWHAERFPVEFLPDPRPRAVRKALRSYLRPWNPLRRRDAFGLVADLSGQVAGYVLYRVFTRPPTELMYGCRTCYIDDIAVSGPFRNSGTGARLLAKVCDTAQSLGADEVRGYVWTGNTASTALFRADGFVPEGSHYTLDLDAFDETDSA